MKIVILERNSVGTDVSVDGLKEFGDVTIYDNTVTLEEVRQRVKDADIVIANKSPLREETLKEIILLILIFVSSIKTSYSTAYLAFMPQSL